MDEDFSWAVLFGAGDDEESKASLLDLYSVFSRPPAAQDEPGRSWAREAVQWSGLLVDEQARLLLAGAGLGGEDVVGAPTTDGAVCVALWPGGSGTSGRPIEFGLQINGERRGESSLVYGLVADEVHGVEIVAAGETRTARMGENAYACELPGDPVLEAINLRLAGGAVETIQLQA